MTKTNLGTNSSLADVALRYHRGYLRPSGCKVRKKYSSTPRAGGLLSVSRWYDHFVASGTFPPFFAFRRTSGLSLVFTVVVGRLNGVTTVTVFGSTSHMTLVAGDW